MPSYEFQCQVCAHEDTEFYTMADVPGFGDKVECPKCLHPAYRREVAAPATDIRPFNKPIEMQSIGMGHPGDIRDFQRRNPDVPIATNPKHPLYGVPIARTRKEKTTILRNEGFQENN